MSLPSINNKAQLVEINLSSVGRSNDAILAGLLKIEQLDFLLKETKAKEKKIKSNSTASSSLDNVNYEYKEDEEEDNFFLTSLRKKLESRNDVEADDRAMKAKEIEIQRNKEQLAEMTTSANNTEEVFDDERLQAALVQQETDFMKRNIELGAEARYFHALNEVEKQRLETILLDEDDTNEQELPTINESIASLNTNISSRSNGLMLNKVKGFVPASEEVEALQKIDEKLRDLMPQNQWLEISSISNLNLFTGKDKSIGSLGNISSTTSRRELAEVLADDPIKILNQFNSSRQKLSDIDSKLKQLIVDDETTVSVKILNSFQSDQLISGLLIELRPLHFTQYTFRNLWRGKLSIDCCWKL